MYVVLLAAQLTLGAQAMPIVTFADPSAGATSRAELRVVAPVLFGTASFAKDRVRLHAMVNAEGWTMPGGHLSTGVWGEGFFDRRHPHTLVHEFVVTASDLVRLPAGIRWSLTAGKGFAPFGTDDPMSRPAMIYPVDHHWSQVLERAVIAFGVRAGPLTVEAGFFNGDEPENYRQWPNWDRFGDSWSARVYLRPGLGLELQGSHARITSPEHRLNLGLDHDLWNVSLGLNRPIRLGTLEALVEWAHADEEGAFQFSSLLAETQLTSGPTRGYLRIERTERPEELRDVGNQYRSVRPHNENSNLGTTRWTTLTAGFGQRLGSFARRFSIEAVAEAARVHVTNVTGIAFDPAFHYGGNDLWMFSVGVRVAAGERAHRMGRYGVAADHQLSPEPHRH